MSFFIVLPFSGATQSISEARQNIDEEIAQLQRRINALKIARNKLSPIARLHNEVLQEIFVLCSRSSTQVGKTALQLTWVCHSWRDLAHQTSELWSYIDFVNPAWVGEALSRTRNRPLQFHLLLSASYTVDSSPLASLCLGNLPRIQTLSIRTPHRFDRFTRMSGLWTNPAPLLVSLTLECISLPLNVFFGTYPSIRQLSLTQCEFDWEGIPFYAGLQSLSILDPRIRVSVEALISKLRVIAPGVESLNLRNTLLPTIPHGVHSSQTGVHFKRVNAFNISDIWTAPVTFLLNNLMLHVHCHEINVKVNRGDIPEQLALAHALVSARGLPKWPTFAIIIHPLNETQLLKITEDQDDSQRQVDDPEPYNLINIHFHMSHPSNLHRMMPVFSILPLSPIELLTLSGKHFDDYRSELLDFFHAQGIVTLLEIAMHFVEPFSDMVETECGRIHGMTAISDPCDPHVQDLDDETKARCRAAFSFPRLKNICYFSEEVQKFDLHEYHLMIFREWFAWRKAFGLDIETLVFKEIVVPRGTELKVLYEGVVDTVECWGIEEKEEE